MNVLRSIGLIVSRLSYDVFLFAFTGYLGALVTESIKPGIIVRYFNINDVLIVVVVTGLLAIILPHPDEDPKGNRWYYLGLVVMSIVIGYILFQLTSTLGWMGYLIGALSALILCGTGILLNKES